MYKFTENQIMIADDFFLPFGGKLNAENRWVKLAQMIPWTVIEERYAKNFKAYRNGGNNARPVRTALGALIIQEKEGYSDTKTVEAIAENPYMQYFIGLKAFEDKKPFDSSLMVHFRKRLGKDVINEVNRIIIAESRKKDDDDDSDDSGNTSDGVEHKAEDNKTSENDGILILDATCTPADIHYPTDLWILNESREKLENIIDTLHEPLIRKDKKPRDYRNKARKEYLQIEKQRKTTKKKIRKAIGKQLRYIRRDLKHIESLVEKVGLESLSRYQYRTLLVITEIYRQQEEMYRLKTHKVEERIVSISQPHIRPIVRGKASAQVEFGAKLAISVVDGFVEMEKISWNAFNEGTTLSESIDKYKEKYGIYPQAVIADKIYRNRENIRICKEKNIRFSGPKLGRPLDSELREQLKQERKDSKIRNSVEGKFGEGKRFYGLNRIMAHLKETSETVIAVNLLVMNLEKRLRLLLYLFIKKGFWRLNFSL
jgi:hypothetical protein